MLNDEILLPYHHQNVQALQSEDVQQQLLLCRWIIQQQLQNGNLISQVLWSDEACLTRGGVTNHHNEYVWKLENPNAIRIRRFQKPLLLLFRVGFSFCFSNK